MKEYKPMAGESIGETCATLASMAADGESVTALFNGIAICATPTATAEQLESWWRAEMESRREKYEASEAGREAAARQAEQKRAANESASLGIVAFDVADESAWKKWRDANEDGGYGECCLRYAARWASMMDARIASGSKLEDIADETSHEADTEGITGFMYGAAVSMLASCWRHREALRKWHNLKTQIRDEGVAANESGGVLNPACVNIR